MGTVSLQKGCLPKLTPLTTTSSLLTALCCSVGTAAKENMKDALKKLPAGETHTHARTQVLWRKAFILTLCYRLPQRAISATC